MSKLRLWLIRHGTSSSNAGQWSANPNAAQLSEFGKEQAQQVALEINEPPTLIITSPLMRAQESAAYLLHEWPQTPCCIWPIQELVYLSPTALQGLTKEERKARIDAYWTRCDPYYQDGEGSESFASFLQRVAQFHQRIIKEVGFVVVVGHGQFFKAFQLGLTKGFEVGSEWMRIFREQEVRCPMKNSEIYKLDF